MGQSDWHLNRNKHNKLPEGDLKMLQENIYLDSLGQRWELQPHIKNKFHQPDHKIEQVNHPYPNLDVAPTLDLENSNLKFLRKTENGGSYEAILQPDGTYLTTGLKKGTYNYSHPDGIWGSLKHVVFDVIPHFINAGYKS